MTTKIFEQLKELENIQKAEKTALDEFRKIKTKTIEQMIKSNKKHPYVGKLVYASDYPDFKYKVLIVLREFRAHRLLDGASAYVGENGGSYNYIKPIDAEAFKKMTEGVYDA